MKKNKTYLGIVAWRLAISVFTVLPTAYAQSVLPQSCPAPNDIGKQYAAAANQVIRHITDNAKGFKQLTEMCDRYGHRLSGSEALEKAIVWVSREMQKDGFDTVYLEPVNVPHWVRGKESLEMTIPRRQQMSLLGLGGSVGTPPEGISAEIIVVGSFEELKREAAAGNVKGKIVVYNVPFTNYGETVQYRVNGANEAARHGAVASLVRSVGPESIYSPHTGMLRYNDSLIRIPAAAITVEDAAMLQRLTTMSQPNGEKATLTLKMEAKTLPDALSHNIIAEIRGREKPNEVIVFGGHIDSWDVGQGAMDDAGGCFAAWEALRAAAKLKIRPRRTLRCVMWTNEENGLRGAAVYADKRKNSKEKHVLAIESDAGTFAPRGFSLSGHDNSKTILREIVSLLSSLKANETPDGSAGADVSPLTNEGTAGAGLLVDESRYFWYHHTHGDTMDKLKENEWKDCAAAIATLAIVAADVPFDLPKEQTKQ